MELQNGVGAAVLVNGIAVPMDSFQVSHAAPVRGRYSLRQAELNDIPLSPRSFVLLYTDALELMRGRRPSVSYV